MKSALISLAISTAFVVFIVRLNNGATADSTLGKVFGKKA